MSRRRTAARHVRNRSRSVAGSLVTIVFDDVVLAADLRIVKVDSDENVNTLGDGFVLSAGEEAWLIGVDQLPDELAIGTTITGADGVVFMVVEGTASQRHWNWWDVENTQRVYVVKRWEDGGG